MPADFVRDRMPADFVRDIKTRPRKPQKSSLASPETSIYESGDSEDLKNRVWLSQRLQFIGLATPETSFKNRVAIPETSIYESGDPGDVKNRV